MIERAGLAIKAAIETVGPCIVGATLLVVLFAFVVALVTSAVSVHGRD